MDEQPKYNSYVVCAWCGKVLRPSNTPENSHSVCPECMEKELKQYEHDDRRKPRPPRS